MKKTILINKENKIKESYYKHVNFIYTKDISGENIQVEEETYGAYLELVKFFKTKNINIGIESAYRSFEEQQNVYDELTEIYGQDYADKVVAPVGTSEHHSGLAIDITIKINGQYIDANAMSSEEEKIFEEIHKYLKDYGFILRYPKDKENITGYPYEPWHIRYVGKFIAKIIYENNYTLEEYLTNYSGIILVNKKNLVTSIKSNG